jgi:predicted pyridoxine 5'-phosphate oxidase superfamily flavin-nucleotide-binding protein
LQKRLIIIPSGNGHFDVEVGTQEVHVTSDSHIVASNSDIVFRPAARRAQAERNSARLYAKRIAEGFPDRISPELAGFIAGLDTAFLATVSAAGAPYIQHRGGPKGFIKVLDERTLGFADYAGNRQYITISNLAGNDHAYLFLLDFAAQRRIKIWGHARVVENDPALLTRLADPGYRARPERAILFTVEAWDVNCTQHITARFTASEVADATVVLRERIAALEAENARLRAHAVSSELPESEAAVRA